MRRAASRGASNLDANRFPSSTRITCRLEPPTGVLRQPEISSNLISARCTFFAPRVLLKGRVLLYIVPILRVASLCTMRSFLRFVSDIKVTRRWVSSFECQPTPDGSSSIIEDRPGTCKARGSGIFHQTQFLLRLGGQSRYALKRERGCQRREWFCDVRPIGIFSSHLAAIMNSRGRD